MMLYIMTLLCNIRSFNALIIIKLEYTVQALPDPDIILYKLSQYFWIYNYLSMYHSIQL